MMAQVIQPLFQGLPVTQQFFILLRQEYPDQAVGTERRRSIFPATHLTEPAVMVACRTAIGRLAQCRCRPTDAGGSEGFFAQQRQRLDIPHFGFVKGVTFQQAIGCITAGYQQIQGTHHRAHLVVHRIVLGNGVRIDRVQRVGIPGGVFIQRTGIPDAATLRAIGRVPDVAQPAVSLAEVLLLQQTRGHHHRGVIEQLPEVEGVGAAKVHWLLLLAQTTHGQQTGESALVITGVQLPGITIGNKLNPAAIATLVMRPEEKAV
ncbi:Uncharacterised protein [Serratia quinivorans]|nr:Uncharacterised protein [Serratia quinivorans]